MRFLKLFILISMVGLLFVSSVFAETTSEDEFVEQYLKRLEKKHVQRLSWVSGYFSLNRINRDNDYDRFAYFESKHFPNADISLLGQAYGFGIDLGMVFKERFTWSVGGEFLMKLGEELSGSQTYITSHVSATVENPKSELKVYGATIGFQYYITNPPKSTGELNDLAIRAGFSVGYYQASWDLWSEYQNYNLVTNAPNLPLGINTTFKDSAPSYALNVGVDYPLKFSNLILGVDLNYFNLNFDQVSWYNAADQEIIVSYNNTANGRVDLNLSGVKGKIEVKRFFSW